MKKVAVADGGCWLWTGHVSKTTGYGQFWDGDRVRGAHQVGFEIYKGPIPEGHEPDHTCRVRHCVNAEHLVARTHRDNVLRGVSFMAIRASQTHCKNGHPLSGDNVYRGKNGTRQCRICRARLNREWADANRARRRELDRAAYRKKRAKHEKGTPAQG